MAESIADVKIEGAPSTPKVTETPEFKQALEEHRGNLKKEYERKAAEQIAARDAEWQAQLATKTPAVPSGDYFEQFETKYGVPKDAARELVATAVGMVQRDFVAPLAQTAIRQELRAQRAELRGSNAKLSALDDRYGKEVADVLGKLNPAQVSGETYASALKLVVGNHMDELEEEWSQREADKEREPEIIRQPPRGGQPASDRKKTILSDAQKSRAEEMGLTTEDFADLMVKRAVKLEGTGLTKAQVRAKLGAALGSLEF